MEEVVVGVRGGKHNRWGFRGSEGGPLCSTGTIFCQEYTELSGEVYSHHTSLVTARNPGNSRTREDGDGAAADTAYRVAAMSYSVK